MTDLLERIAAAPGIARAREQIRETDAETIADMRAIAAIPAPSGDERARAVWLAQRFRALRLSAVACDDVGNVRALLPGAAPDQPPIVVAAHLDTVFPADTDVAVREAAGRILAPGIADNARGVAAMLAIARALAPLQGALQHTIAFVGTAGEEGVGDLAGVKHLFANGGALRHAAAFIAIDGAGSRRVVVRAVGSRRSRITFTGAGGHSWSDRGTPNPAHALGLAIARLGRIRLAPGLAWSVSVGRIGGGTSINAIPASAWLELDVRAEDPSVLARLERRVDAIVHEAATETSDGRRRGTLPVDVTIELIGDRPAAAMPSDAPLVRIARAATRHIGEKPEPVASSTDANVPMALGIPAIAIGGGGESGGTHTLGEWYANDGGIDGCVRAMLIVAAAAGLAE